MLTGAFYPILCGSAFKNKGVQPLLDAVVDYLPSPVDIPPTPGIDFKTEEPVMRQASDDEPLSVLAFKIMDDPFVGSLTFCRIYSGKLESGMGLLNSSRDRRERVGRMLLMHSNNREDIKEAFAGDIVALAGPEGHPHRRHPVRSEQVAGDPGEDGLPRSGDRDRHRAEVQGRPGKAGRRPAEAGRRGPDLPRLHRPGVAARPSCKGMGELHLDIKVDILKRTYKVEANIGAPQVAYRETLGRKAEIDYTHKKQTGGSGQFARDQDRVRAGRAGRRLLVREPRSSAATCRRNSSPASRRAWRRPRKTACWPASR